MSIYSLLCLLITLFIQYPINSQLYLLITLSTQNSLYLILSLPNTLSTQYSLYLHTTPSTHCCVHSQLSLYSLQSSLFILSLSPSFTSPAFSLIFPLTSSQNFAELRERVVMQRLQLSPSPNCPSIYKLRSWGNPTISVSGSNVQCSMCSAVNLPNDCKVACFMNEFQIQLEARRGRGRRGELATYSRMQNTIYYKGKSCRQHDNNNNNYEE